MLVASIKDHSPQLGVVEQSLKLVRYSGGLVMLLGAAYRPLGERLKALGNLRMPIWTLYAVRDIGQHIEGSEKHSPMKLLFRSIFLVGLASRTLKQFFNWRLLDVTRKVTVVSPFIVLFWSAETVNETLKKDKLGRKEWLNLVDSLGEGVATAIDDAGLIPDFPGIEWVEVTAGLSAAAAGLTKKVEAVLEERGHDQA